MNRFKLWLIHPTCLRLALATGATVLLYGAKLGPDTSPLRRGLLEAVQILLAALTSMWIWSMYSHEDLKRKVTLKVESYRAAAALDAFQQVRREYAAKMGLTKSEKEWKV